ncbi:SDR family oxidoreductase [Herbiconiux sp. A18JL235]|uniref:SDR family oxidoreductase n=1 Tax=Herbiconiux sp. A18JL235 TaxID=3152363 RepID=A0AB39BH81_9MICO
MKVVVLGGTGLVGAQVVERMRGAGHEVMAASPASGVDTVAGTGLAEAFAGASVVVDVVNSRSFEGVREFLETSTRNALDAANGQGVGHYVLLSIVGTDHITGADYTVGKTRQEELVRASGLAFSIVRATQFFEFIEILADGATVDGAVHATAAFFQPVAASEVAEALADVAAAEPLGGTLDVAGPERTTLDEMFRSALAATGDPRPVVTDDGFSYFGSPITRDTLVPVGEHPLRLGDTGYSQWLRLKTE